MIFDGLKKHHLGVVIAPEDIPSVEKKTGRRFIKDEVQGVQVCFTWNPEFKIFFEYITKEGRAKNYEMGFHHVCYDVESLEHMKELETQIKDQKLGFRLTFPEPSPCEECQTVCFYKIKNLGIVEFNIHV